MIKRKNGTLHWLDHDGTQSLWSEVGCPHCGYRMKLCSMCDVRDGIQVRTVDDLGRICIPKDIRDKLGIKPGTECAVYVTDELTSDEIIVIRRNKNEKTP